MGGNNMIASSDIISEKQKIKWLDICDMTAEDADILANTYHMKRVLILYAENENERPHYDLRDPYTIIVYDVPYPSPDNPNHFITGPITLVFSSRMIFTFHDAHVQDAIDDLARKPEVMHADSTITFLLNAIFYLTASFAPVLNRLTTLRNQLDKNRGLNSTISNNEILLLSDIEKSLVYLNSSTATNLLTLEELKDTPISEKADKDDLLIYHRAMLEAQQMDRIASISEAVSERITATSNNLLNNNLNDTMKFLTVWSLVLTIPTIATGFYGMNVFLPIASHHLAWLYITIGTIVAMVVLWWYLHKKHLI